MSAVHSIHFPAAAPLEKRGTQPARINILEVFSSALVDAETIRETLRGLVKSGNRHGDLQAALSAARRVETALLALIEAEEAS